MADRAPSPYSATRSLEAGTHRGDPLGVEAEPVHPSHVAGVLDLQATVHHHGDTGVLRDLRTLGVDHAELGPERVGADRHRVAGDVGQGLRRPEDVDEVDVLRDVAQARVAVGSQDLGLAGVHREHAVSVALEVVADEVAGPQLVAGEAHDRDRLRAVQHALDGERFLVGRQASHAVATVRSTAAAAPSKPCWRSHSRSSTDSVPTERRTVPGPTPAARSSSSLSWRCVVLAGWMTRLFASPTFARWDQSDMPPIRPRPPVRPPAQSNENTAPAPRGRYFSTSGRYPLEG